MGHRDITPVHVPLRTSSRRPSRSDPMETQDSPGAADRQTSKAQRFFGTDITLPQEHAGWKEAQKTRQPSYIKPTSAPRQSTAFHPFPNASDHIPKPDHNLRVRASSPLLGHDYKSQEAVPPMPKPKKVHHSGSSNALFSYFSSKESKEAKLAAKNQSLQPEVRNGLGIDPQVTFKHAPEPPKESKRKMRPPRIDLSVLFPKPRNPAPQTLLSPQRMVSSPSSVSTGVTDRPSDKLERPVSNSGSKRYSEAPRRASVTKHEFPKHVDNSDLPSIAESRNSGWFDQPLERTVGTSEIDVALDRYAGRRSLFSRSSVYTTSREHLSPEQPRPQEPRKSSRRPRTPSSQPKEMYLSPTSYPESVRARGNSTSQESNKTSKTSKTTKTEKSSVTKKSSKSTLKNKDLQNTSILCLSSSEDEDEDQTPTTEPPRKGSKHRDSVGTYDESEPEIYMAATARAATATAAKRFDRAHSTSSGGSRQTVQSQPPPPVPRPRKASQSSNGKSSTTTRRTTQTRRSSGVPTIAEPDILSQFPQQPLRSPAELKEMNRRSRYIAVTRQEQDLLEAMRIRKGKVTPSLFNANASDRRSVVSGPSRDSFCGSDTSFLRLSNAYPPFDAQSLKSTAAYKDGMASSGSDSEQKGETALSSPGFSADYSESLPSPRHQRCIAIDTDPADPSLLTPPFPQASPKRSSPAIPEDHKQHTRRRTIAAKLS